MFHEGRRSDHSAQTLLQLPVDSLSYLFDFRHVYCESHARLFLAWPNLWPLHCIICEDARKEKGTS